jgi:hypothetical protein
MTTLRVELTPDDDDRSRRRRDQRNGVKALLILAGLIALAFAAPEPNGVPEPAMHLTPSVTDFGVQDVGAPSAKVVTLSNAADKPFVISGIVAEGASSQSDFSVDATRCTRLEPGSDCIAVVSFTPHAPGAQSAKFRIVDASNASSETIVARGAGIEPVRKVVSPVEPPPPPTTPLPAPAPAPAPLPQPVAPPSVAPQPVVPQPVVPQPPRVNPQPGVPQPPPVTAPKEEPAPDPEPEKPIVQPQPEPAPAPQPPPATTTTAPERNKTKDTLKKIGRVALGVAIGAIIANNTGGHGHHDGQQQSAECRIEVSPGMLKVTEGNTVTVRNRCKNAVAINSIQVADDSDHLFTLKNACAATLAPGKECSVYIYSSYPNVRATLVVDSSGGRKTVDLWTPPSGKD